MGVKLTLTLSYQSPSRPLEDPQGKATAHFPANPNNTSAQPEGLQIVHLIKAHAGN